MHAIPAARYLARRKRQNLLLGLLALVALCMLLLGVSVGNGVVRLPLGFSEHELALFVRLRLPRVLMGALVGAGLAMSGTLAQAVLRNPLASPFTLGISSGAAFGAALAILLGGASQWGMAGNAFVFAALTAFAALGFARLRDSRPETLILGGVAIMFLFSAATSLLQYVATEYEVQAIVFWGFGNLGRVGWSELGMAAVMILLPVPFALKLSWDLNALLAGEETASSLGVNVRRLRIGGILAASLMAAGAICFTGVIGFIGLVLYVQYQSEELPVLQCTGSVEMVSFRRRPSNQGGSPVGEALCQNADSIGEIIRILLLVSQSEEGDFLAGQVETGKFGERLVPVGRQFAVEPGGRASDDIFICIKLLFIGLFDRNDIDDIFSERFLYLFGDSSSLSCRGSVK